MLVYLLRHGIAAELGEGGVRSDADRPLTDEGRTRLRDAAKGYRKAVETPAHILVSPLLRARQTAQIVAEALRVTTAAEECRVLVPEADPHDAAALLQAEFLGNEAAGPLLLVGHEPHLGSLLGLLLTGSERTAIPFKKGMLVGVDLEEPQTMIGRLVLALTQRAGRDLA